MRLLLVEDDPAIAEPLVSGLSHHGITTVHVATGAAAIEAFAGGQFDMVLLDLGLPDMDGLDVCREIRRTAQVPVIIVTARGEEIDRVVGLELGADDYVVKPFGIRELVARIRAVRRRFELALPTAETGDQPTSPVVTAPGTPTAAGAHRVVVGALQIDNRTHRVSINDMEIALTPKEFGVLSVLAVDPGAVVTRTSLIEQVWDEHWYGPTKTLDVHVAQLRQKLGDPRWIETVRGVGYRLVDPGVGAAGPANGQP